MKGRKRLRALAFGTLTLFAILAVAEIAARVIEGGGPRPAPTQANPFADLTLPEKPLSTYRIFLYGGSTVKGAPVAELSFARRMEFWLRRLQPSRQLEVFNFGLASQDSNFVRRLLERTLPDGPDLLVVLTGHNEFLRPERTGLDRTLDLFAATRTLRHLRNARLLHSPSDSEIWMPKRLIPIQRSSLRFRKTVERYERNLASIVGLARDRDLPLVLATLPANLAEWPPAHRFLVTRDDAYEETLEEAQSLLEAGQLSAAEGRIEALLEEHPGDAMGLYLKGRLRTLRGELEAARSLFRAACDADPFPWRALSRFNETIRRLAAADDVHLADVESAFERHATDALVGFELVADNAHPTPHGSAVLADVMLRTMARHHLFLERDTRLPSLDEQRRAFESQLGRGKPRRSLRVRYLLENAKYTMKTPFYNYRAAERYLLRARDLAPDDWRVWANLATVSLLTGRESLGRAQLDRATQLAGRPLNPEDRGNTPYLMEALDRAGLSAGDES